MNRQLFTSFSTALLLGAATLISVDCTGADGSIRSVSSALQGTPTVTVAATGLHPVDTAPDKNGNTFYFIGSDVRGPGVFRVAASGKGNPVHDVTHGGPLVAPTGIAAASKGERLYVADPAAGAIFAVGARSGRVEGTLAAGTSPHGVDCADDETLYFTGNDARGGKPGLFRVSERGQVVAVATGAPFSHPGAVALSHDGIAYVSDTPGVPGAGRIIVVDNGSARVLAEGLNLGDPAGVALTLDDSTLLVSGIDGGGHSQVYLVDTSTGAVGTFNGGGIGVNTASGGVHRAANRDVFGWAGRTGGGTVYNIAGAAYNGRAYNGEL